MRDEPSSRGIARKTANPAAVLRTCATTRPVAWELAPDLRAPYVHDPEWVTDVIWVPRSIPGIAAATKTTFVAAIDLAA